MKVSLLPLNELYAREKITASVEAAIHEKEDFSKISSEYCEKVCRLKCKAYEQVSLAMNEVDILIIQDHAAPNGKWDRIDGQQEKIQQDIIAHLCRQAGFDTLKYRLVNLLKCAPNEQDFPNGKPPTATTLMKCKPYLLDEIERCKPKIIISLATAVTKALGYKKHSNSGNRGEIVDNVVITIHPRALSMIRQNASGAFWGQELYGVILRDFQKAARLAKGEMVIPNQEESIKFFVENRMRFARSLEEAKEFMAILRALPISSVVSFDTETTSLDPHIPEAKLLTIQFGYRDSKDGQIKALVIPLWHRCNTAFDPNEIWGEIAEWLEGPQPKVGHNAKYDVLYIYFTKGVRVRNIKFDTMLLLHSLDSGAQGTYSLKTATWDFLPHLGFGGYEDLLPSLTKAKDLNNEAEETEETEND
ncbi:DNA polymerase I [compost metagenome]